MLSKIGMKFDGGGRSPQPIDNAKKCSLLRLNEQSASKRRIGLYLARWLGWAAIAFSHSLSSTPCWDIGLNTSTAICFCSVAPSVNVSRTLTGDIDTPSVNVTQCDSELTTATCSTPYNTTATGPHYYVNTSETPNIYFKCNRVAATGGTEYQPSELYTPISPPPISVQNTSTVPTPFLVPFAPLTAFFIIILGLGAITSLWRNLHKSHK